jgi:hypothetical protein
MTAPDAPAEDDSERNGFLSYAAEWHAFSHGVFDGMRSPSPRPGELPDNPDVEAEPHYYKGAYVIGTLLQLGIAVGAAGQAL